jgi:uncharacterized protein YaaW (UPF0174 family)
MKTTQKMNLRPTRLVLLLGAIGFATIGAQAQQAANADARGKMIDNSSTRRAASANRRISPACLRLALISSNGAQCWRRKRRRRRRNRR